MLHNILLQHGLNGEEFDDPEILVDEDDDGVEDDNDRALTREGEVARNYVANFFINN